MELKMNNKIVKNVNVKLGFPLRKICKLHFHERAEKKKNRRGTGTQKSKNNLFLKTHNIKIFSYSIYKKFSYLKFNLLDILYKFLLLPFINISNQKRFYKV